MEINTIALKNEIDKVNGLINQYEEIELNIFNQLKNVTLNWRDGHSQVFEKKISLEQRESKLVLQSLKNKKDVLQFIYDKYSSLAKTIKCNLDSKDKIVNMLDSCISKADSILDEFRNIDRSFYYSEIHQIDREKRKVETIRSSLKEIRESTKDLYKKIAEIEKEVSAKMNSLEEVKINDFDANLEVM